MSHEVNRENTVRQQISYWVKAKHDACSINISRYTSIFFSIDLTELTQDIFVLEVHLKFVLWSASFRCDKSKTKVPESLIRFPQ